LILLLCHPFGLPACLSSSIGRSAGHFPDGKEPCGDQVVKQGPGSLVPLHRQLEDSVGRPPAALKTTVPSSLIQKLVDGPAAAAAGRGCERETPLMQHLHSLLTRDGAPKRGWGSNSAWATGRTGVGSIYRASWGGRGKGGHGPVTSMYKLDTQKYVVAS